MLVELVHLPTAYAIDPDLPLNSQANERYLALLQTLRDNGVLVVDAGSENDFNGSRGTLQQQIRHYINQWPPKFQPNAKELLEQLDRENRIVGVRLGGRPIGWLKPFCEQAIALAYQERPDGVVAPSQCSCGRGCFAVAESAKVNLIPLDIYAISEVEDLRHRRQSFENAPTEIAAGELEAHFYRPLFRYAKRVNIYDRYVGIRYVQEVEKLSSSELAAFVADRQAGQPAELDLPLTKDICDGARALFAAYAKHSVRRGVMTFYTELSRGDRFRVSPDVIHAAAIVLQDIAEKFTAEIGSGARAEMVMIGRPYNARYRAPHDRYIITDQICLMVGKGVDLFRSLTHYETISVTRSYKPDIPHRPFQRLENHILGK